jgi:predicted nuclease of predicted toxin-antitoxin system
MRIIANENVMATVVGELRNRRHDVLWVKESMPQATDVTIFARAQSEQRLVLTHDKDFGELAFRYGLSAECGVLLIRLSGRGREADIDQVLKLIESRDDWPGHFSVATRGRVRMRPLPSNEGQRKPK